MLDQACKGQLSEVHLLGHADASGLRRLRLELQMVERNRHPVLGVCTSDPVAPHPDKGAASIPPLLESQRR